ERSESLYEGHEGEELAEVAPYLVALPHASPLLERLVQEGWGSGWGIYLTSTRPFQEVRRSLRRLLVVEVKESGEELYFRFYDPAIAERALPELTPRQAQTVFAEIDAFVWEGEGGAIHRAARPEVAR